MSDEPSKFADDKSFADCVIAADAKAVKEFYATFQEPLTAAMLSRFGGQHAQLAVDAVAEVLGECVAGYRNRAGFMKPPRLAGYRGGAPLRICLSQWCRCRVLDKLKGLKVTVCIDSEVATEDGKTSVVLHAPETSGQDEVVVEIIRQALVEALAAANPEGVVLMRLAFLYRIPQNVLARAWQRHPAQITKRIGAVIEEIQNDALARVRAREPNLDITWEDVMAFGEDTRELLWDDVPKSVNDDGFTATSSS